MSGFYLEVDAKPRYWEDGIINGNADIYGKLIPFREGESWKPIIQLDNGMIKDWPNGTVADIRYKICDQGEYWLQDKDGKRIAKWTGDYVPNDFLCHGGNGYGDYIIFKVNSDGFIENYRKPEVILTLYNALCRWHQYNENR